MREVVNVFKEIIKDFLKIIIILFVVIFFSILNVYLETGNLHISLSRIKDGMDYYAFYYLPLLIFFYFLRKNF